MATSRVRHLQNEVARVAKLIKLEPSEALTAVLLRGTVSITRMFPT